jgi:uncharacterized membrane protein
MMHALITTGSGSLSSAGSGTSGLILTTIIGLLAIAAAIWFIIRTVQRMGSRSTNSAKKYTAIRKIAKMRLDKGEWTPEQYQKFLDDLTRD